MPTALNHRLVVTVFINQLTPQGREVTAYTDPPMNYKHVD